MIIILVAIIIGLLPASIAAAKGRNFILWWIYGAALFIIALPHALFAKSANKLNDSQQAAAGNVQCPACAEWIKPDAKICRFCKTSLSVLIVLFFAPASFSNNAYAQGVSGSPGSLPAACAGVSTPVCKLEFLGTWRGNWNDVRFDRDGTYSISDFVSNKKLKTTWFVSDPSTLTILEPRDGLPPQKIQMKITINGDELVGQSDAMPPQKMKRMADVDVALFPGSIAQACKRDSTPACSLAFLGEWAGPWAEKGQRNVRFAKDGTFTLSDPDGANPKRTTWFVPNIRCVAVVDPDTSETIVLQVNRSENVLSLKPKTERPIVLLAMSDSLSEAYAQVRQPVTPPSLKVGIVRIIRFSVNVRAAPSTSAELAMVLKPNAYVTVTEKSPDGLWSRVKVDEKIIGWILDRALIDNSMTEEQAVAAGEDNMSGVQPPPPSEVADGFAGKRAQVCAGRTSALCDGLLVGSWKKVLDDPARVDVWTFNADGSLSIKSQKGSVAARYEIMSPDSIRLTDLPGPERKSIHEWKIVIQRDELSVLDPLFFKPKRFIRVANTAK